MPILLAFLYRDGSYSPDAPAAARNWSRRIVLTLAALATVACCASIRSLVDPAFVVAPRPSTYTAPAARYDVDVTREVLHDAARNRDVPITIYTPRIASGAKLPLVVFSHGIGEDRDSYEYLGRGLAARGFLAVHVTHFGTDKSILERGYWKLYKATKQKENWVNRPRDVSFVLDALAKRANVDASRIAAAGHSAGAFTALALAGLRLEGGTLDDPRVKVAVALSMPKLAGAVAPGGYDAIRVPTLHMTGTCDGSIIYRTRPRDRRIPFVESHAAHQYLVTIEGLRHETFSDRDDALHPEIVELVSAFLDGWLNDDANARAWFDAGGAASLRGVVIEKK